MELIIIAVMVAMIVVDNNSCDGDGGGKSDGGSDGVGSYGGDGCDDGNAATAADSCQ